MRGKQVKTARSQHLLRSTQTVFSPQRPNSVKKRTENICTYIMNNYDKKITVQELADISCMCSSTLSRVFKDQYGLSIREFIKNYRIDKVKHFLKSTHDPIYVIAEHTGFQTVTLLNRMFKDAVGMSPSEYKALNTTHNEEVCPLCHSKLPNTTKTPYQ